MPQHKLRRPFAGLTAGVLAGAVLTVTTPAAEAAAFTESAWDHYQSGTIATGNCTPNVTSSAPANTPIAANGVASVKDNTLTLTNTSNIDPTDVATTTLSQRSIAKVSGNGNEPAKLSLQYSGTATTTTTKPVSACTPRGGTGAQVDFAFTLTRPMWVDMTMVRRGSSYSELYLYDDDSNPYTDVYGQLLDVDVTQRVYLPAGDYGGYLEGDIYVAEVNTAKTVKASGNLTMTFTPAGARSGAPAGKGRRYVAFPLMRDCGSGSVLAKVTSKKVRAKKIDKIVVRTNGVVKRFKKTPAGKVLTLPAAANRAANINAKVVLKNGEKKKVTTSYLACRN